MLDLMTSDEYPAYETAILDAYGEEVTTTATGRVSRKMVPEKVAAPGAELRHGREAPREGPGGGDRDAGGLRDDGGGAGGVVASRRRAGGSTRRSWSGRTRPTGTTTPGRCGRRTRSARTGGSTRR